MRKDFGKKTWMYPLPVLIVGTYDENGNADAMNAAWGGIYDTDTVVLCLSADHKTTKNIMAKGAFTVSFADEAHTAACDYLGIVSGNDVPDKLSRAGFTAAKSGHVDAPIINELPMTLECRLVKFNEMSPCSEKTERLTRQSSGPLRSIPSTTAILSSENASAMLSPTGQR